MSTRTDTRRAPGRDSKAAAGGKKATQVPSKRATARPGKPAAAGGPRKGQGRAPRIPFVLLILCLLGATLVSLLVLRSVIAQEAFAINSLRSENSKLAYQEQQKRSTVARLEASERIAEEAEEMGMEQGGNPLFLDPDRAEVIGSTGSTGSTGSAGSDE